MEPEAIGRVIEMELQYQLMLQKDANLAESRQRCFLLMQISFSWP